MHVHTPPPRSRVPARLLRLRAALLAAALLALIPALTGCGLLGDDLGPDELPDEITSKHREQIQDTLERFFAGVDANNPERASASMLIPSELTIPEVQRMVLEISAVDSLGLDFNFSSLGAISREADADAFSVTAVTALGPRRVEVLRRDGEWLMSRVPDLTVKPAQGGLRTSVEVTSWRALGDGRVAVVGWLQNDDDRELLPLGTPAIYRGADGRAVAAAPSPFFFEPFLQPSERMPFRVDLILPDGETFDAAQVTLIPNIRVAHPDDHDVLTDAVSVEPAGRFDRATPEPAELRVRNGGFDPADVSIFRTAFDVDGTLIDAVQVARLEVAVGAEAVVPLSGIEALPLPPGGATEVTFWAGKPISLGR